MNTSCPAPVCSRRLCRHRRASLLSAGRADGGCRGIIVLVRVWEAFVCKQSRDNHGLVYSTHLVLATKRSTENRRWLCESFQTLAKFHSTSCIAFFPNIILSNVLRKLSLSHALYDSSSTASHLYCRILVGHPLWKNSKLISFTTGRIQTLRGAFFLFQEYGGILSKTPFLLCDGPW